MALHLKSGTAPPTTIPTEIGQHFVDTAAGQLYISSGTSSSTDWKRVDNDGSGVTTFLGLTDSPINYVGAAGQALAVTAGEDGVEFIDTPTGIGEISLSTGLLSGCQLTQNINPSLFDMAAGIGIHVDNTTTPGTPIITPVAIPERLDIAVTNIGTQPVTVVAIDISGNIIQRATGETPTQRRDTFDVGNIIHTDFATIIQLNSLWVPAFDISASLKDLMSAIGFFLTGGNEVTGVAGTLSIQKTAGTGFSSGINVDINTKDPHSVVLLEESPITFFETKQDGVVFDMQTTP